TLLHTDEAPDSILVPGRTRPSFLSGETAKILFDIALFLDIVLATGRSLQGTKEVIEGLRERHVPIFGVVLEDGALYGKPEGQIPLEPRRNWGFLREALEGASLTNFLWQEDFTACLVARCEKREDAMILEPLLFEAAKKIEPALRCHRDGRKVYLSGETSDKWTALQKLLGAAAASSAGIGDGLNDLCWLSKIKLPCTLQGSEKKVIEEVIANNGQLSQLAGHAGIAELLRFLEVGLHDREEVMEGLA
ncbi:MAG TPA: hypothetical protein V6C82_01655, partial [Chroococcales cyanobacterium]